MVMSAIDKESVVESMVYHHFGVILSLSKNKVSHYWCLVRPSSSEYVEGKTELHLWNRKIG